MKNLQKLLLLIAVLAFFAQSRAQDSQPFLGTEAPPFQLASLQGEDYTLEQWEGNIVVIHFATTWCPFCNAEAPHLEQLYKDYRDKGVQVLIIDVMEEKPVVEKSFSRFEFSFPVLLDTDGQVASSYAPDDVQPDLARHEVPIASNLIVDRKGKIRFYSLLNTADFDAKLVKLKQKLDSILAEDQ